MSKSSKSVADKPCERCGYCPSCGRANFAPIPWNPYPYWPYTNPWIPWTYPTWTWTTYPNLTTGGTTVANGSYTFSNTDNVTGTTITLGSSV